MKPANKLFTFIGMKIIRIFFTVTLIITGVTAWADAGFSIRRRTAAAQITFEGTGNLTGYQLFRVYYSFLQDDTVLKNPFISDKEIMDDKTTIVIQNGGKRWDESDRYLHFALIKTDTAGTVTDTFTVYMKKWNYHMVINGVKDGKLQYSMKKSKAYFDYTVVTDDERDSGGRVNRWIFIASSLTGFILLIFMFLKRKKIKLA
ncbi:MAG TPA: hypothetical protein VFV31_10130 [Chitinophagaceae bacterium]|nr:hypothetical protein [Chitinophagaceae bacterium]